MIQIDNKNRTEFLGRNGVAYCKGFTFLKMSGPPPAVRVYPITSKGMDGRGFIEIPIEEAGAFINALRQEMGTRQKMVVDVEGGIVQSIDTEEAAEVLIRDKDDHTEAQNVFTHFETDPTPNFVNQYFKEWKQEVLREEKQ